MRSRLNIVFAGTPEFAVPSLSVLVEKGYAVRAVYTQPDRPSGRGQKLTQSPVKTFALAHQIPVYQPKTLKSPEAQAVLADLKPDLVIVAAYGLILPETVLKIPRWGCINVHASLLPRWRGASPIQHAILAGDQETGITIMQMDVGLDTGDILYQASCPIEREDTAQSLHDRLAKLGGEALLSTLEQLLAGQIKAAPQIDAEANYAHKISKQDGAIDWTQSAVLLARKIRAFTPWPTSYTSLSKHSGLVIRVCQAEVIEQPVPSNRAPGTILQANKMGIDVATGDQILRLTRLQLPGGKSLTVREILNAHQAMFEPGTVFQS